MRLNPKMSDPRVYIQNHPSLVPNIYLSSEENRTCFFHTAALFISARGKCFERMAMENVTGSLTLHLRQLPPQWPTCLLLGAKIPFSKKRVPLKNKKRGRERKEVEEAKYTKKDFRSLLGKQTAFVKQHFDELSANESGVMRNTWAKFSLKYTSLKIKRKKCLGKMCFKF